MTDPRDQAIEVLRATGAIYGPTLTANERVVDALIGAGLLTRNPDNDALAEAWDAAIAEARTVVLRGRGPYETDIDLLTIENPYRVVSSGNPLNPDTKPEVFEGSHYNMCGAAHGSCFVTWCTCPCHKL